MGGTGESRTESNGVQNVSVKARIQKLEAQHGGGLVLVVVSPGETNAEAIRRHERQTGRTVTGQVLLVTTGVPDREHECSYSRP